MRIFGDNFSPKTIINMALSNSKKQKIAESVIKVLFKRFSSFPEHYENNRNAPFHVAFLNAFSDKLNGRVHNIPDYISLSSWLHGLNTTLGQSFFETTAHILCDGDKRDFNNVQIYESQKYAIDDIITKLKNSSKPPSVNKENEIIMKNAHGNIVEGTRFTADCIFENDNEIVAIELKSVRPNSGEMKGEKQKILNAKAVLKNRFPQKRIKYYFGFPFDPTSKTDTGYNKTRFLDYLVEAKKFCDEEEVLIGDELWSYLAGSENTMTELIHIINRIATPDFMENFNKIQEIGNERLEDCRQLLESWYLYSEIEILNNIENIKNNKELNRILYNKIFKTNGEYNTNRLQLLNIV